MSNNAAFTAVYSNFKPIPSRKVVQITLEAPMEAGDHIIGILGMPNSETSKWVGVALLQVSTNSPAQVSIGGETPAAANGGATFPPRRDEGVGNEPSPAQRPEPKPKNYTGAAKSLARNPVFWEYLSATRDWEINYRDIADDAEVFIEKSCNVKSCTDIKDGTPAGDAMARLLADFYEWERLNQQHGG